MVFYFGQATVSDKKEGAKSVVVQCCQDRSNQYFSHFEALYNEIKHFQTPVKILKFKPSTNSLYSSEFFAAVILLSFGSLKDGYASLTYRLLSVCLSRQPGRVAS